MIGASGILYLSAGYRHYHAGSKALFGMMGVFAEFERSMMQERVKAGIKRVRAKRQQWGRRKIEEPDPALGPQISELRQQGYGWERSGNGSDRVLEQSGDVCAGAVAIARRITPSG